MRKVVFINFEDMKSSLNQGENFLLESSCVTILDSARNIRAEYNIGPQGQVWEEQGEAIKSLPPKGYFRVTNLYVDPSTGKMVVKYDDTPA